VQYLHDFMVSMLYILHVKPGNGEETWCGKKIKLQIKMQQVLTKMSAYAVLLKKEQDCKRYILQKELQVTC
jgi:hypothetical protein